jgi:hypothetical protein
MAHNIYATRIYVEYQTKNSNSNLVLRRIFFKLHIIIKIDINDNPCYFLTLLKFSNNHSSLVEMLQ